MDKYNILIAEDDKEIARSIGNWPNYNGPHDAKTFWRRSNN